ncbi:hypothetical protein [Limosilactobacillus alvi]|nr:hypothetical protein [Limosilactobacillus alvi]
MLIQLANQEGRLNMLERFGILPNKATAPWFKFFLCVVLILTAISLLIKSDQLKDPTNPGNQGWPSVNSAKLINQQQPSKIALDWLREVFIQPRADYVVNKSMLPR